MAGRQAWCPRCDELREARAGAGCPVCGRHLLAVPQARPGQPPPRLADRVAGRLGALLPAAGAVGVALLVAVTVASAFAAGRLTRTTPSAPAAAPATTIGFVDEGPVTSRRELNWQDEDGGITVRLRSVSVGTGFTRLELHVNGVTGRRQVSALAGLRVRDADGNDLLPGGELTAISTAESRSTSDGGIDTEVVLDRALDQQAVATVELRGLTVGAPVEEHLSGFLVDRELIQNVDQAGPLAERRSCPGCQVRMTCQDCRTVRVIGTAYRRGLIAVALEAVGALERSAVNPSRRRVVATGEGGVTELPAWIDGTGKTAVITIPADALAGGFPVPTPDTKRIQIEVSVVARAEQAIDGQWAISQPGGGG